jgi:ABC-type molybdate transport system ATPase subunit
LEQEEQVAQLQVKLMERQEILLYFQRLHQQVEEEVLYKVNHFQEVLEVEVVIMQQDQQEIHHQCHHHKVMQEEMLLLVEIEEMEEEEELLLQEQLLTQHQEE